MSSSQVQSVVGAAQLTLSPRGSYNNQDVSRVSGENAKTGRYHGLRK